MYGVISKRCRARGDMLVRSKPSYAHPVLVIQFRLLRWCLHRNLHQWVRCTVMTHYIITSNSTPLSLSYRVVESICPIRCYQCSQTTVDLMVDTSIMVNTVVGVAVSLLRLVFRKERKATTGLYFAGQSLCLTGSSWQAYCENYSHDEYSWLCDTRLCHWSTMCSLCQSFDYIVCILRAVGSPTLLSFASAVVFYKSIK